MKAARIGTTRAQIMAKSWEDFLSSFDEAQPDVVIPWGTHRQPKRPSYQQRQKINLDKFAGGTGPKKVQISPKDQERIRKLEAIVNDPAAYDGEKAAAQAAIKNIRGKYEK